MIMKNVLMIVTICLTIIVQACNSSKVEVVESTPASASTTPTSIVLPSPTPVSVETAQNDTTKSCVELKSDDTNKEMDGFLLLDNSYIGKYSFMNLKTMSITKIPEQAGEQYLPIVSPDGKHLIGEVCAEECNYVLRTPDQVVNTIPSQDDWVMRQWLDNERVIILTLLPPHNVLIMNPFTGDIEKVSLHLNDPFTTYRGGEESLIRLNIDRSLSKVLYYDEHFGGRLILWDIKKEKELISLPYNVNAAVSFDQSSWSPDGESYLTTAPDDNQASSNALYSLGMNGNLTQLTFYDQQYPYAKVAIPVWSPDNQHIAFWVKISALSNVKPDELLQYLAIMDISTLETKIYCQTFSTAKYPAFPVVWSPDGLQLVAPTRTDQGVIEPVIIDLIHLTKTKINTQDSWVEGWLLSSNK